MTGSTTNTTTRITTMSDTMNTPTNTPPNTSSLSLPGLETVYDTLATAIDQAGPEKAELFLVKLALLNAHALGDHQRFQQHVADALQDLT